MKMIGGQPPGFVAHTPPPGVSLCFCWGDDQDSPEFDLGSWKVEDNKLEGERDISQRPLSIVVPNTIIVD